MIKILLISDNLNRELEYLKILKKTLENELRAEVNIIGSIAEVQRTLAFLYEKKPDIVIMSQVQEKSCRQIAQYIKHSGSLLFIIPSEVTLSESIADFTFNDSSIIDNLVDLYFMPGIHTKKFLVNSDLNKKKMLIVGSPKIDATLLKNRQQLMKRSEFIKEFNINKNRKNIFLFSFPDSSMDYFKTDECFLPVIELVEKFNDGVAKTKEEYLNVIPKLAKEFSNFNIIIKPHPLEKDHVYSDLVNQFDNLYLVNDATILDCINSIDIAIHWTSTISVECWIYNLVAIQFNPVKSAKWIMSDFHPGNPTAENFTQLKNLIRYYLTNSLEKKYLKFQEKYLLENFYKLDGKSSLRISRVIGRYLETKKPKTKYQLHHSLVIYALIIMERIFGVKKSRQLLAIILRNYQAEYAWKNYINI